MGEGAATPEVVGRLVLLLGGRDGHIRCAAARSLGQMGPRSATSEAKDALVAILRNPDKAGESAAGNAYEALLRLA
ncbi:MAG: HEAT repeat domain-containing protein [Armatimonadetes bacterium]|nr:HEAT repeat domain-containing protein [Armatimonadota bacterium]